MHVHGSNQVSPKAARRPSDVNRPISKSHDHLNVEAFESPTLGLRHPSLSKSMHSVKAAASQLVAPDGGFGWVVVFGSFLVHVVMDGITYSFGALLPHLLDKFQAGEASTGAVGSTLFGVTLVVGPAVAALVNRFGCRSVTVVGGLVATIGCVLSVFSPNITFMLVFFGIVTGLGAGLIYLPAIVSVTQWFEKRRSFATGIAVCGSGLGTFAFPPLTEMLIEQYNWNGALLIIAGIVFNNCVFGMLFRPVEYDHTVTVVNATESPQDELGELPNLRIDSHSRMKKISTGSMDDKYGTGSTDADRSLISAKSDTHIHVEQRRTSRSNSIKMGSRGKLNGLHSSSIRLTEVKQDGSVTDVAKVGLQSPFTRKDTLYTGSLSTIPLYREDPTKYKSSMLDLSKATVVDAKGSPSKLQIDETAAPRKTGVRGWCSRISTVFTEMMDPVLLTDWIFLWFSISNFFTSIAFQVPYIFLIDRAEKEYHIEKSMAAWLVSAIGIGNIFGRLGFGLLSDFKWVNRLALYNVAVTVAGVAMFVSVWCRTFVTLAIFAAVFGIFIGAFVTLTPVILVDLFGLERLTNAFGILLLFQGIASFVGPPIAGYLKEVTGDYDSAFLVFGLMMAASGAMLFFIPCLRTLQVKCTGRQPVTSAPTAVVYTAPKVASHNGKPLPEETRLLDEHGQVTLPDEAMPDLVLPSIQINDRRASATPGAVVA
ncbi:hypothetical protein RvY_00124 [Ramazzottius varieornatus]|uniref:Major facilitator superfamily (MFS) profile domain-containing protein n=1 Tax=Ramazzottius varieornatus TaxID=947166 RepID=A0A1D1UI02_RAMVA|nr:hypothetical protein RvY_00124 [Ramazzottius varieornatus]